MSAVNIDTALMLIKTRLNRMPKDTTLDMYFTARVQAAEQELEATGIVLNDTAADMMLVVDYTVWQYQNRDHERGMPDWLRLRRRERWLQQRRPENESG